VYCLSKSLKLVSFVTSVKVDHYPAVFSDSWEFLANLLAYIFQSLNFL